MSNNFAENPKLGEQKMFKKFSDIDNDEESVIFPTILRTEWSMYNEELLAEWSDVAQCYKWMHMQAHKDYVILHTRYTIPSIILSTVTGAASFATLNFKPAVTFYASIVIGTVNIFIGMLSAIQQYLQIAEFKEAHIAASVSWDKLARSIKIELAKRPGERMDPKHFIKMSRSELDRLMESSPIILQSVVDRFFQTFAGDPDSIDRELFDKLNKPDICNSIISINITRRKWFGDIESNDNLPTPPKALPPKDSITQQINNLAMFRKHPSFHIDKNEKMTTPIQKSSGKTPLYRTTPQHHRPKYYVDHIQYQEQIPSIDSNQSLFPLQSSEHDFTQNQRRPSPPYQDPNYKIYSHRNNLTKERAAASREFSTYPPQTFHPRTNTNLGSIVPGITPDSIDIDMLKTNRSDEDNY